MGWWTKARARDGRTGANRGATALILLLGALACLPGPAEIEPPPDDTRSFLFVGNSLTYTNDLPAMVERLLEAALDEDVYVASESLPNWGLPDHWSGGRSRELIAAGGWELVILQQGPSATEGRPYLLDYAEAFAAEIRTAGAEPALFMVWPAASRPFDFDGVLDSYRTAAERVDGYFFPSGEAWRVAWETDPELTLYGPDGFHPSVQGTYVAALVMVEQIADVDARDLSAADAGLSMDADVDALLRAAAHEANERHARVIGGGSPL
jgi:hypothetical protein